jgi:hypothetical protein
MKVIVLVAFFVVVASALPTGENQEANEAPLTIVDLEPESESFAESDVVRAKRQYG